MDQKRKWFVITHAMILLLIPLFYIYRATVGRADFLIGGCFVHDVLCLYCFTCGGTRAVEALLHFDLVTAFSSNAYVTVLAVVVVILDIVAWVRFFMHKKTIIKIPVWAWITFGASFVAFGVLRNVLMIAYGFDPLGDLAPIWDALLGRASVN